MTQSNTRNKKLSCTVKLSLNFYMDCICALYMDQAIKLEKHRAQSPIFFKVNIQSSRISILEYTIWQAVW